MPPELAALLLAVAVTLVSTPAAIALARRTSFLDRPAGYKRHGRETPYLGGVAVMAGFLAGALAFGGGTGRFALLIACAGVVHLLGTADDRLNLSPGLRVVAEVAVAAILWSDGLGWNVLPGGALDLALTIVWVVGVVNAFNLMDNMDGAAASTGAASALGIGTLALATGQHALAALCLALAGACAAFLRFNLARPSRIFLGDGGSMPLGLLVAAAAMIAASHDGLGLGTANVLVAALMVGAVVLDTTLVTVSRLRGGRPLLSGGNDHLTHRLRPGRGSARGVAVALAVGQLALCAVALGAAEGGLAYVVTAGLAGVLGAGAAIARLEALLPQFADRSIAASSGAHV
jgi:UDP-GlcNAc:undecaprenyl-phosphate GlcNAc-1-phosphate transferase